MGNFGGKTMADFGGKTMYGRLETDFGRTGNDFSRYVPRHVNNTTYDFYHWLPLIDILFFYLFQLYLRFIWTSKVYRNKGTYFYFQQFGSSQIDKNFMAKLYFSKDVEVFLNIIISTMILKINTAKVMKLQ